MQLSRPADRLPQKARSVVIAAVALGLAVFALLQAAGEVFQFTRPDLARRAAPWDGAPSEQLAEGIYAGLLARGSASRSEFARTEALARDAYRKEPLTPGALAVIASGLPSARRPAVYRAAASISRRDPLLQAKLLEYYTRSGQLEPALEVLNQIVVVQSEQRDTIFAKLIQVLRDPRSVGAFYQLLSRRPEWGDAFLIAAAHDKASLDNLIALRRKLGRAGSDSEADRALITALASANKLAEAYEIYRQLPGKREIAVSGWSAELPPLEWQLTNEPGLRAQVEDESPQLHVEVSPGYGGVIAQRVIPAPSQPAEIRTVYSGGRGLTSNDLTIQAECVPEIVLLGEGGAKQGILAVEIPRAVPGCAFMRISLSARAWSGQDTSEVSLSPITIEPLH